jgi:hypothetical protein
MKGMVRVTMRRDSKLKIVNSKSDGPAVRKRYVWRLSRFQERFEMEEYRRQGGLDWVRMFVTSSTNRQSNESSEFLQQFDEIDHYYPEQRDAYEGRFWRLMRLTATKEDWLRGYLLDEECQPLSDARIAARLHLDGRVMKVTLAALKRVGLIEYVPCPNFQRQVTDPSEPDKQGQSQADSPPPPVPEARTRKRSKTGKQGVKRAGQGHSELFRKSSECSKTLLNEMTNGNSNENQMANGQGPKGQTQTQTQANPNGVSQGQAATSPATTPPEGPEARASKPQDVTVEGLRHPTAQQQGKPATAPPGVSGGPRIVPLHGGGNPSRLGVLVPRAMDGLTHGYSLWAPEFAREIFGLLRAPFGEDSRDGQRELGNYRAAWLDAIDAGLSTAAIDELRAKTYKDAHTIGGHRKRYYAKGGSPEQYWRFLFNRHMAARLPAARSPPQEGTG